MFVIPGVGAERCHAVDFCGKNFEDLIQLDAGRINFLSLSAHLVFELMFLNNLQLLLIENIPVGLNLLDSFISNLTYDQAVKIVHFLEI